MAEKKVTQDAEALANEVKVLQAKLDVTTKDLEAAELTVDELKAKIVALEAAPQVDSKGKKIHKLKGTKRAFRLRFATRLGDVLVNDDAIAADNDLLAQLVRLESGAIEEVE